MSCMDGEKKTYTAWRIDGGVHKVNSVKPITTPAEQVETLKAKGVTFEQCSEDHALEILSKYEIYLHLTAYRVLFQRHTDGSNAGKFVSLDFGDLLNLCKLDDQVREALRLMAKDIERAIRVRLINDVVHRGEDGYGIVADYMESLAPSFTKGLQRELNRRIRSDVYTGTLISHYRDAMPVWVLLEVVPFGTLLAFYLFCVDRWGEADRRELHYALKDVKAIRNCASHSGCLINGFSSASETKHVTSGIVIEWLNEHGIKNTKGRRARLRNRRVQQLVTTVALYDAIVGKEGGEALGAARALKASLTEHAKRYGSQNAFVSYLAFLAKVLDAATA